MSTVPWRKRTAAERKKYFREYHQRPENAAKRRDRVRKRRGLPEPTRPEPALCECCGRPPNMGKTLAADHDHTLGTFRGWICAACNLGLGMLGDSISGVAGALKYLERA